MRTVTIILAGFIILAIVAFAARQFAGDKAMGLATLVFIPLWLAAALINMWMGVTRAGYGIGEELPIMLLIFAPPAALAGFLWWKFS